MSHHVEAVEIRPLVVPLKRPFQIASSRLEQVQNIAIAVGLDSGAVGIREIATLFPVTADRFESALEAAEALGDWLEDQVFEDWRSLIHALRTQEAARSAIAAGFEMAICDAMAVEQETPLHLFFGTQQAPVMTDMTIPICAPLLCETLAREYCHAGFSTLKLKVGLRLEQDLAALKAIRNGHPTCRIVADANEGFTLQEAHHFLDELQKANIHLNLFEQPVARRDFASLRELQQRGDTLIAADESCRTPEDATRLAEAECVDILNIKLAKSGVLGGLAIHKIARSSGLGLMIGGMVETRIGMGFAAHFAHGLGGFDWVDLDTPQLLAEDPVLRGTTAHGPNWNFEESFFGHGASLEDLELF